MRSKPYTHLLGDSTPSPQQEEAPSPQLYLVGLTCFCTPTVRLHLLITLGRQTPPPSSPHLLGDSTTSYARKSNSTWNFLIPV